MFKKMKQLCQRIFVYAKTNGIQEAECCLIVSKVTEIKVKENQINQMNSIDREEVLVRILKDGRSISVLCSTFDFDSISKAMDESISALLYIEPDAYETISAGPVECSFSDGIIVKDYESIIALIQQYIDETNSCYPNIHIAEMRLPVIESSTLYANTNNVELKQTITKMDCFIDYTSVKDMLNSYFYDYSFSDIPEHLLDLYEQRFWFGLKNSAFKTRKRFSVNDCQIILAPPVVEDIIIDGICSFCNDQSIISGTSIWKDAIGAYVSDKRLSVSLDPFHPDIVCGERITDDGTISRPFYIIENGILRDFCLSRRASLVTGQSMAANTSDSIIVTGGNKTLDGIISQIHKGIIISRYSGGEISPTGDFSGLAKNCYLIEDGTIVASLDDLELYGNVITMLKEIGEMSTDHNKNGYNVIPWMLVNNGIHLEKR